MLRSTIILAFTLGVVASTASAQPFGQNPSYRDVPPARTYDNTQYGRLPTPPGGVPGNAPFNNQIRKHTAPLSANGGR